MNYYCNVDVCMFVCVLYCAFAERVLNYIILYKPGLCRSLCGAHRIATYVSVRVPSAEDDDDEDDKTLNICYVCLCVCLDAMP